MMDEPIDDRGRAADPTLKSRLSPGAAVQEVSLLSAITLVVWVFCLLVGLTGLLEQSNRGPAPATQAAPLVPVSMEAELAPVRLAGLTPDQAPAPPSPDAPPPDAPSPTTEQPPELPVVAAPSASIAFAQPVAGPVRLGTPRDAVPTRPLSTSGASIVQAAPAQRLTFGRGGEPRQPDPQYPREAQVARQQGAVEVTFNVGTDGRVTNARISQPSPWPLLNRSALATVRNRWRFGPGPPRSFVYTFEFVTQSPSEE